MLTDCFTTRLTGYPWIPLRLEKQRIAFLKPKNGVNVIEQILPNPNMVVS